MEGKNNADMKGLLALLNGGLGCGKTAFAKVIIRNLIQKFAKSDAPVEGIFVFCGDPSQWTGIVPNVCVITPIFYNDFQKTGKDWWDEFYRIQQEKMKSTGKYSKMIVVVDDIFLFPGMVATGGNRTTPFERVLSMYRMMDLHVIVTAQRVKGYSKAIRDFAYVYAFWPRTGQEEIDTIYQQFGGGVWKNKDECRDEFRDLSKKLDRSFVYINKRRQSPGGEYEKQIKCLTPAQIEGNQKMKIEIENIEEMIAMPLVDNEDHPKKKRKAEMVQVEAESEGDEEVEIEN